MKDKLKTNQNRADYLKNYIKDETWYNRVESYTSTNFDQKYEVHKEKIQKKQAKKSKSSGLSGKISAYFGERGITDHFFFVFNVVLALYNFWSVINIKSEMAFWFGAMGVYYAALAFLRFLLLEPKPWPFHNKKFTRYFVRRCQSVVFCGLGGVLPFVLFFTMTVFSHSHNDNRIILLFLIYTIFKTSAFISKFVTYKMQLVSPWSPINSINHVELMMAILTMLRYWLGTCGDETFGMVYLLTAALGIAFILAIIMLGVYAGHRAEEHKRKMDAGIDEEAEYRALELQALQIKTANVWEKLGVQDGSKSQKQNERPASVLTKVSE